MSQNSDFSNRGYTEVHLLSGTEGCARLFPLKPSDCSYSKHCSHMWKFGIQSRHKWTIYSTPTGITDLRAYRSIILSAARNCSYWQLVCANGNCVSATNVCNGYDNCGDLSDELQCNNCPQFEFSCRNGKCISNWDVCDKRNDCGDWSDEEHCRYTCLSREFSCSNGHCVDHLYVCDGDNDCGDWSDEQNCTSTAKHWYSENNIPLWIGINVAAVLFIVIMHILISRCRSREAHRQPLPDYETHPPHQKEFINPLCTPTENAR